jgi:hypothetical protein
MLKIVPVGAASSFLNVAGSTCGRAGRRLRRMIFLTRLPSALVVMMVCSVVTGASSVDVEGATSSDASAGAVCADGDWTSAMVCGVVCVVATATAGHELLGRLADHGEARDVAYTTFDNKHDHQIHFKPSPYLI